MKSSSNSTDKALFLFKRDDYETTLQSLSTVTKINPKDISSFIQNILPLFSNDIYGHDLNDVIYKNFTQTFTPRIADFIPIFYHATRTWNPDGFLQKGIVPIHYIFDNILNFIQSIITPVVASHEWDSFLQHLEKGELYSDRFKIPFTLDATSYGIYAFHFKMAQNVKVPGIHNYLDMPEWIEDLHEETTYFFNKKYNREIYIPFKEYTKPYIVHFVYKNCSKEKIIKTAILFLCDSQRYKNNMINTEEYYHSISYDINLEQTISPKDILSVEEIKQ